jgi:hypothetical protein
MFKEYPLRCLLVCSTIILDELRQVIKVLDAIDTNSRGDTQSPTTPSKHEVGVSGIEPVR